MTTDDVPASAGPRSSSFTARRTFLEITAAT
jgi:hypothetical protein